MRRLRQIGLSSSSVASAGAIARKLARRIQSALPALLVAGLPISIGAVLTAAYASLPPVPVPPQNPITEQKRILGKLLFWDEQMSTSNAVSCGACHIPGRGGTDPRLARHPGPTGAAADDIVGSPGIVNSNSENDYQADAVFALMPQVTPRASVTPINAAYARELFWDGRATSQFVDPDTNQVVIPVGGAMESQAIAPIVNNVEMAHAGIDFSGIASRLASVRPMELATNLPPDMAAAVASNPTYGQLFAAAFGDSAITARRIAFAIATYQRTLIADQTPWDRFDAGDPTALNAQQIRGLNTFNSPQARCAQCHTPPMFTNDTFRNIGIRPPTEDLGRQIVTGNPNDRGRFKVPSLRNVGLMASFAHNGQFTQVIDVLRFYVRAPGSPQQFQDNIDPLVPGIAIPPQPLNDLDVFLRTALTDPRVQAQSFPFDKPTLFGERAADRPTNLQGGTAGSGGRIPSIIVDGPAMLGLRDFRVGLGNALGGASARLAISFSPPVNGRITPSEIFDSVGLTGTGAGNGVGTTHWALSPTKLSGGQTVYAQWIVADGSAAGGEAFSQVARIPVFCGSAGCRTACEWADLTNDGAVDFSDFLAFFNAYDTADRRADLDGVPGTDFGDFLAFFNIFDGGC
jgi:cytochrome c peroxidase